MTTRSTLEESVTAYLSDPDTTPTTAGLAEVLAHGTGPHGHQLMRLLLARHAYLATKGQGMWAHTSPEADTPMPAPVTGLAALRYAQLLACAVREGAVTARRACEAAATTNVNNAGHLLTAMGDAGFFTRHRAARSGPGNTGPRVAWKMAQEQDPQVATHLKLPTAQDPLPSALVEEVAAWAACDGHGEMPQSPEAMKHSRTGTTAPSAEEAREAIHAFLAQHPKGTPTPEVLAHFRASYKTATVNYNLKCLEAQGRVLRTTDTHAHVWYALAPATPAPQRPQPVATASAAHGSAQARPPLPTPETIAASALKGDWRPVGACGCHLAPTGAPLPGDAEARRLRDRTATSVTELVRALHADAAPEEAHTIATRAATDLMPVLRTHLAEGLARWAERLEFTRADHYACEAEHQLALYRMSVLREVVDWLATTGNDTDQT
ncbi:hypothetical protein ABZ512_24150 [Nocardiopsis dassonvillei]|uniref:hypothetical protein n=1 Tax=Nocardiopsis dassonvillei TaxID=2014 RepID=UPI0033F3A212